MMKKLFMILGVLLLLASASFPTASALAAEITFVSVVGSWRDPVDNVPGVNAGYTIANLNHCFETIAHGKLGIVGERAFAKVFQDEEQTVLDRAEFEDLDDIGVAFQLAYPAGFAQNTLAHTGGGRVFFVEKLHGTLLLIFNFAC